MMNSSNRIFLFSVGINRYKSCNVRNLSGCEKDVEELQDLLKGELNIPDENCMILLSEQASRKCIISGFRQHFSQLQDGDVAIFHYSGHGSWKYASDVFIDTGLEAPGGRIESLMSYDYKDDGVWGIADKELRCLISELQYPANDTPKSIHFIGLMDCCHSGSIFRIVEETDQLIEGVEQGEFRKRGHSSGNLNKRPLGAFLEGQFLKEYEATNTLTLPKANYIVITAAGHKEYAREDTNGGLFSQSLIRILKETKSKGYWPTYAELYFLISIDIWKRTKHRQNPQFEYSGKINPYQCFALNGAARLIDLPKLVVYGTKNTEGRIDRGAIHGIDYDLLKNSLLPAYAYYDNDVAQQVGVVRLTSVQVESSIVHFSPNNQFKPEYSEHLTVALPVNKTLIKYAVDQGAHKLFTAFSSRLKSIGLDALLNEHDDAKCKLYFQLDQISIFWENELLIGVKISDADVGIDYIIHNLYKVIRWEQVKSLTPPVEAISEDELEKIDFSFSYITYEGIENVVKVPLVEEKEESREEIQIPFNPKKGDEGNIYYKFKLNHRLSGKNKALFFYIVHIDRKLNIAQKVDTNKPVKNQLYDVKNNFVYDSKADGYALGITDLNTDEVTDIYQLIVSKNPLYTSYLFEQRGLEDKYGKILVQNQLGDFVIGGESLVNRYDNTSALWHVKTLKIKLVREK